MSTFNYPNADNSATLNALLADLAAGIEPRVCIGCGCTDANACVNPLTGEACRWVQGFDMDLCSACASIALRIADKDEHDVAEVSPRIQIYTQGEVKVGLPALPPPFPPDCCSYCGDPLSDYDRFESACESCRENANAAAANNADLVQLYTEADANREIADRRAIGGAR